MVVGDKVLVTTAKKFSYLCTQGFPGIVEYVDNKNGVCTCLHISRIYKPCFWYAETELTGWTEKELPVLTQGGLEVAMGLRGSLALKDNIIGLWCLRSWMMLRVRPPEGHELEKLILRMQFQTLEEIFSDYSNRKYNEWIEFFDSRPRRALISESEAVSDGFISIARPKIRG